MNTQYPATLDAAHERLAAVDPAAYARSRNHIGGAVTRLSPYLTHGLLTLPEAYHGIHTRSPLEPQGKLVFEFGWREYHRHVWAHIGDRIHRSLHTGLMDDASYAATVPEDVQHAATGIPAIDTAVRTLYLTGYLHNHARMWLASYLVHLRKVHWHAGASWMIAHLLDGDIASNHLSWQWVAGTGSTKPYLFNAENVARYAPQPWHSPGTVIDTSYESLDQIARNFTVAVPHSSAQGNGATALEETARLAEPPTALGFAVPDARAIAGKDVWLVHAWSLGQRPLEVPAEAVCIAVLVADFHQHHPWSALRWNFVGERMAEMAVTRWFGDANTLRAALAQARCIHMTEDLHLGSFPHPLRALPYRSVRPLKLFEPVDTLCRSFSSWWRQTRIASIPTH